MRRAILILIMLALLVLVIQKARRLNERCGCVETCTCRDPATCECKEEGAPLATG